MDMLDWGHGPNQPVFMFSEQEIATTMSSHHPVGAHGGCSCAAQPTAAGQGVPFDADHFLAALRDMRRRCTPALYDALNYVPPAFGHPS